MEDDVRTAVPHEVGDRVRVTDVGEDHVGRVEQAVPRHGHLDLLQRRLVPVEHEECRWVGPGELPAEFAADGSPCAGDEHTLPADQFGRPRHLRRIAADTDELGHTGGERPGIGGTVPAALRIDHESIVERGM